MEPPEELAAVARCGEQVSPHQSTCQSGTGQSLQKAEVWSPEMEDLCAHQKILGVVVKMEVWSPHTGFVD